jgi:GAF domain-containing protein
MKLDEQSVQNLLAAAFTIQEYNDRHLAGVSHSAKTDEPLHHVLNFYIECLMAGEAEEHVAEAVEEEGEPNKNEVVGVEEQTDLQLNPQISSHRLREIVQQVLQATNATSAAIALKQQGRLTCLEAAGDCASEISAMISTESGFTGVCASSKRVLFCTNTMLDSRVDADSYRKIGIRAVIVVPLLHRHQLLGLISVFSRKPYAFGEHSLQALQGLAQKFTANLQVSVEPAGASTKSAASC